MSKLYEEVNPFQYTGKGKMDVRDAAVRDNINTLLTGALMACTLTPYIALEKVRKVLAYFHISIPGTSFMEGDRGIKTFEVEQFGLKFGMKNDGQIVNFNSVDKDMTHGAHIDGENFNYFTAPGTENTDEKFHIYFEYKMNDKGLFDVFSEIVTDDELEDLLDDAEEDINADKSEDDRDERLNEANLFYEKQIIRDRNTISRASQPQASNPRGSEVKKIERTGGGDYNVYGKNSQTASEFRDIYSAAKKSGSGSFDWQGRNYTVTGASKGAGKYVKPADASAQRNEPGSGTQKALGGSTGTNPQVPVDPNVKASMNQTPSGRPDSTAMPDTVKARNANDRGVVDKDAEAASSQSARTLGTARDVAPMAQKADRPTEKPEGQEKQLTLGQRAKASREMTARGDITSSRPTTVDEAKSPEALSRKAKRQAASGNRMMMRAHLTSKKADMADDEREEKLYPTPSDKKKIDEAKNVATKVLNELRQYNPDGTSTINLSRPLQPGTDPKSFESRERSRPLPPGANPRDYLKTLPYIRPADTKPGGDGPPTGTDHFKGIEPRKPGTPSPALKPGEMSIHGNTNEPYTGPKTNFSGPDPKPMSSAEMKSGGYSQKIQETSHETVKHVRRLAMKNTIKEELPLSTVRRPTNFAAAARSPEAPGQPGSPERQAAADRIGQAISPFIPGASSVPLIAQGDYKGALKSAAVDAVMTGTGLGAVKGGVMAGKSLAPSISPLIAGAAGKITHSAGTTGLNVMRMPSDTASTTKDTASAVAPESGSNKKPVSMQETSHEIVNHVRRLAMKNKRNDR